MEHGRTLATPGALQALEINGSTGVEYLDRHLSGDWGNVGDEDWEANDRALQDGERVLSCYALPDHTNIWIITEADRSATTILLPEDY